MSTPKAKFAGLALIAALCAGFTLGLTAPGWAGLDEAEAAQGNAKAQSYLGLMYYDGWGVPQDYAEAVKWWRKAAEQGYGEAQFNLGYMYR